MISALTLCGVAAAAKPHVIEMVIDDLGWNDLGYHNTRIKTPFIDSLASTGVELTDFYFFRFCSPSRSSFQSGRLPWHTGQQTELNLNPMPGVACGINLEYNFTGAVMKQLGYKTAALGKVGVSAHPSRHRGESHFLQERVSLTTHPTSTSFSRSRSGTSDSRVTRTPRRVAATTATSDVRAPCARAAFRAALVQCTLCLSFVPPTLSPPTKRIYEKAAGMHPPCATPAFIGADIQSARALLVYGSAVERQKCCAPRRSQIGGRALRVACGAAWVAPLSESTHAARHQNAFPWHHLDACYCA